MGIQRDNLFSTENILKGELSEEHPSFKMSLHFVTDKMNHPGNKKLSATSS
jgi:hypothetical protein